MHRSPRITHWRHLSGWWCYGRMQLIILRQDEVYAAYIPSKWWVNCVMEKTHLMRRQSTRTATYVYPSCILQVMIHSCTSVHLSVGRLCSQLRRWFWVLIDVQANHAYRRCFSVSSVCSLNPISSHRPISTARSCLEWIDKRTTIKSDNQWLRCWVLINQILQVTVLM